MGLLGSIGSAMGGFAAGATGLFANMAGNAVGQVFGQGDNPNFMGDMVTGGAISNNQAIERINAQNIHFAQKQQDFQERMSNTAYQRAMSDMKSAGLNPMLAYMQGGASVPQGTSPTLNTPRPGDIGGNMFSTAKDIVSTVAGLGSTLADTRQKQAAAKLNDVNAEVAEAQVEQTTATAAEKRTNEKLLRQQVQKTRADTRTSEANAISAAMEAGVKASRFEVDKKMAPLDAILDRVRNGFGTLGSAFDSFQKGARTNKGGAPGGGPKPPAGSKKDEAYKKSQEFWNNKRNEVMR